MTLSRERRIISITSKILSVAVFSFCFVQGAYALSDLCVGQEGPVFSCATTDRKLASVCSSPDLSETGGCLVYRFGSAEGKIELSLPKNRTQFRKYTSGTELVFDAKDEDDEFLRFRNGPFSYVTYAGFGKQRHAYGVAIFRGAKLIKTLPCDSANADASLNSKFQAFAGIPEENGAAAQRIWDQLRPNLIYR